LPNGNNPFLEPIGGGEEFSVEALINYLSGFDITTGQFSDGTPYFDFDLLYNQQWSPFSASFPLYGYQGISPEISSALQNVFTFEEGDSLDIESSDFIINAIQEQIQEQLSDYGPFSNQDLPSFIDPSANIPSILDIGDIDLPGLEDLDLSSALGITNIFDPESIASTLTQIGDLGDAVRAAEVTALTPEMLKKTQSQYYDPYEERGRKELVDKLGKGLAKATTGGFAGSGVREKGLSGAEELYRGGYEDLLKDIMGFQAGATEDVLDTIYSWQELLSEQ